MVYRIEESIVFNQRGALAGRRMNEEYLKGKCYPT